MSSAENDQKFLLKSSILNIIGAVLKVSGPALNFVVARYFGKEAFGIYISTQLWVSMMSRAAVLGLDKGLTWYVPQNKLYNRVAYEGIAPSLRLGFYYALLVFAVIVVMALTGSYTIFSGLESLSSTEIILYIMSIVPWVFNLIFAGASEGNRKPQYRIFINDFAVFTFAPLFALIIYFITGDKVYSLPIGLLCANCIAVLIYMRLMPRQFPGMKWLSSEKIPKALLSFSLPIGFSEFVVAFLLRADLWMVLVLLGPEYAGVYAIMVTISNAIKTVRQNFNSILFPVVAGMEPERMKLGLPHVYSYCVSLISTIQIGIGFFIVLFPEETLMLAGKSFVQNPEVLGILLFAGLFDGSFCFTGMVLNGMGKSKFLLKLNVYSLILAVSMNLLLIPKFGLVGAAISTLSFQIFQGIWMNAELLKNGIWPYRRGLWVQLVWAIALLALFVLLNTGFEPEMWQKIAIFVVTTASLVYLVIKRAAEKPPKNV